MDMEKWERNFENLGIYTLLLILLSSAVFLSESKLAWPVTFMSAVAIAFVFNWIQKGPELQQIKDFLDRHGIQPIHLWIGITVVYYGLVGIGKLIS